MFRSVSARGALLALSGFVLMAYGWEKRATGKAGPKMPHPEHPQAGLLLIDVNRLVGVLPGSSGRWILEKDLQPVGGVFGSHLLFDIRPEDLPGSNDLPVSPDAR